MCCPVQQQQNVFIFFRSPGHSTELLHLHLFRLITIIICPWSEYHQIQTITIIISYMTEMCNAFSFRFQSTPVRRTHHHHHHHHQSIMCIFGFGHMLLLLYALYTAKFSVYLSFGCRSGNWNSNWWQMVDYAQCRFCLGNYFACAMVVWLDGETIVSSTFCCWLGRCSRCLGGPVGGKLWTKCIGNCMLNCCPQSVS